MDALEEMGLFREYLDVTPFPRALGRIRKTAQRLGRDPGLVLFSPVPRAFHSAANAISRARTRGRADAWIVPAMGYGRPVGGRIASLCEVTPAQLQRLPLDVVQTMWRGITPAQLRAFGHQQERLHRSAHACCTASHWAARSLVEEHGIDPARVHVVGYGANLEVTPPTDRDWSKPRFLFVGGDWHRKNGDGVVRAFTRVRERHPEAQLDLVGGHPRIDTPGVVAHGRQVVWDEPGSQILRALFRGATCFVMPSLHESFGIVYVEAARAGVPSIGTTSGGTADSVGDGGLLVSPGDDDALYDAMMRLAQPDEAQALGAKALERSALFTWRKVTERIVRSLEIPGILSSGLAEPV
jgi:glycosyltransferase involved in cell wall biosynthesis